MKKLTRSEKLKVVELAKTIVIVLLFSLCLFLGYRILSIYKAQTNVEGAIWGSMGGSAEVMENGSNAALKVVCDSPQPHIIAANTYTARQLLKDESQMFEDISKLSNQLIGESYKAKNENISVVDIKEWQNALVSDSLYIKYPASRFLSAETELYGIKPVGAWDRIKSFDQVAVVWDKTEKDTVTLFIADCDNGTIVKVELLSGVAKEFREKVRKINIGEEKEYVFAWELNLDNKDALGKTALDSMLLIPVAEEKAETIGISVPRLYKSGLNFTKATDLTLGFVNAFNYNPNTIRQYVSQDNSIMFVGETGSLNLHPDGIVEYKALDAEDGVLLSSEKSMTSVMHGLCVFLEKIMRIGGINTANADFAVKLTGMPQSFKFDQRSELYFDYFVADKKVEFSDSNGILAVVKGGNLIELKMHIKNIEAENKQGVMPVMFDVIDEFCAKNPELGEIRNVYGVYKYSGEAENIEAEWKIEGVR